MRTKKRKWTRLSDEEKKRLIELYHSRGGCKDEFWRQFIDKGSRNQGRLLRWMRQLGLEKKRVPRKPLNLRPMGSKKKGKKDSDQALTARIKELEKQLEDSRLKEEAYRRMIQIAEKDLKIDIQKKSDTK
ncbi:hypothetical protein [Chryseolinea soli]|uniref:Transposase n=1 Tax=Chryseolinea soli TaxID=2321403 RepID=A0A385SU18_9BACT|nr:hypothetical protein [Chryseolinea soli]AYB30990.1 hypothetical protein D4L85_10540 [Chryseolinea soli]AYB33465.1 hypothetical protein D4L85_24015 [Chryseolinea soli]AYB34095.1 hypothetical protein D4L85_27490 [Chryseolinea soli]AYB34345.1 hypothetical protein D4L85_28880 [Chryseolinea soli]AYB35287.1 hypothetical protein D4L85_33965 [Chryseolinea soli]